MTQKSENILSENNIKIKKQLHAFKGFASSYNVKILIFFNPELQLKDAEPAIKRKLIDLLTQLKDFKFVTTLVLGFKKIESQDKTKYETFYSSAKEIEIIVNESDISDVFLPIYTTNI